VTLNASKAVKKLRKAQLVKLAAVLKRLQKRELHQRAKERQVAVLREVKLISLSKARKRRLILEMM